MQFWDQDDIIYEAVMDDGGGVCRSSGRLSCAARFQPLSSAFAKAFLDDIKRPRFDCVVLDLQLDGIKTQLGNGAEYD